MKDVLLQLQQFSHLTKCQRYCRTMMAWRVSATDQAKVRNYFISLDKQHKGIITKSGFRSTMHEVLGLADYQEVTRIFEALDYNQDKELHYSDFLAAILGTNLAISDE